MINVSTKVNLLLTAEIDRIRNYNIFEKRKGRLQTISNLDKFVDVRQNPGNQSIIELTPGLLHVNGVIIDIKEIESLSVVGLSDGIYRVKVEVDNSLDPAVATFVAEQTSNTLQDQDLTELENGKADIELATFTLTSSNVTNFEVTVETIKTTSEIYQELLDKTIYRRKVFINPTNLGINIPTSIPVISGALLSGEEARFLINGADLTDAPLIVITDNFPIILTVKKLDTGKASVSLRQMGTDEPLFFDGAYDSNTWSKYEWIHTGGHRTLISNVNFLDGTIFNTTIHLDLAPWKKCDILYNVDKWDTAQTNAARSTLYLSTTYGVSNHFTIVGDITNWNNTSNKTLTLKRLTHSPSSGHSSVVSSGITDIRGTLYEEVQP